MKYAVYIISLLLLLGCSTKRIVDEKVVIQKDTVYERTIQRDSIFHRDSVFTFVKGDTLIIKEWHDRVFDKSRIDTIYKSRCDTLSLTETKYVEVEKKPTWWDRLKGGIGLGSFIFLILSLLSFIKNNKS